MMMFSVAMKGNSSEMCLAITCSNEAQIVQMPRWNCMHTGHALTAHSNYSYLGMRLLCSKIYPLFYAALLKIFTDYAHNYATYLSLT